MKRFLVLIAAAAVSGCAAQKPELWVRADGRPNPGQQTELDTVACRGEMEKARLSAGGNYQRNLFDQIGDDVARAHAARTVFVGCMASKGYVMPPPAAAG